MTYALHPGGVPTDLALGMSRDRHAVLVDTPELAGHTVVFLTRERREWLAGRYMSAVIGIWGSWWGRGRRL